MRKPIRRIILEVESNGDFDIPDPLSLLNTNATLTITDARVIGIKINAEGRDNDTAEVTVKVAGINIVEDTAPRGGGGGSE